MKKSLIALLKQKGGFLLYLAYKINKKSFFKYHSKKISGQNNKVSISNSSMIFGISVDIVGEGNTLIIDSDCLIEEALCFIRGNNNKINISEKVKISKGCTLWIEDNECEISVGKNSSLGNAHIAVTENNSKVIIGEQCIFAKGIDIRTGDSHSIIDAITNKRINYAQDVHIGNHVWLASHVSVLKGSSIPDNSVVATRSVVTKKFTEEGLLLGGTPAKILKNNIKWIKERI